MICVGSGNEGNSAGHVAGNLFADTMGVGAGGMAMTGGTGTIRSAGSGGTFGTAGASIAAGRTGIARPAEVQLCAVVSPHRDHFGCRGRDRQRHFRRGLIETTAAAAGCVTGQIQVILACDRSVVSGAAALLMEWGIVRGNDVFLYGEKVKAYLRAGARPLRGERETPNDRVGFGALCVENSLPI